MKDENIVAKRCEASFSVVVLGYRNAATIVRAVESVVSQLEPGVEVVVVTSGPDSGADAVRAHYPHVVVVEVAERLMPGGARNRGIDASTGDVVGFLAADCLAVPGWLRGHRVAHARGYRAVSAAIVNAGRSTPWAIASWLISYSNRLPGYPSGVVAASSARRHGLSIDRRLVEECGRYDERIRIGEDTAMADRILAAGHEIWFEGSAHIAHSGPIGTLALMRDEFRRGRRVRQHRECLGQGVGSFAPLEVWVSVTRHTLAAGWRFGSVPRWRVVVAAPWVGAAVLSQQVGFRRPLTTLSS